MNLYVSLALCLFVSYSRFAIVIGWSYETDGHEGPEDWYINYSLCADSVQSPIEIPRDELLLNNECTASLEWNVDDTSYDWSVDHNGHSIVLSTDHNNQITLTNSFPLNDNQHSEYIFRAFHFHWGNNNAEGSEHIFDTDSITTTFEVHFVHYSADYNNITAALNGYTTASNSNDDTENDAFTLAVVGVLFEEVDDDDDSVDQTADLIVQELANMSLWHNVSLATQQISFAITDLVDSDDFMQNYFFYYGSLTTPPCAPAVRWHVAQNTIKIKSSTMDTLRTNAAIWSTEEHDIDENFRPIQTNPNCVFSCSDGDHMYVCPEDTDFHWNYENTSIWQDYYELCAHEVQSPIEIPRNELLQKMDDANVKCKQPLDWDVGDTVYNWTVLNNGHSIMLYTDEDDGDITLQNAFNFAGNNQHSEYIFDSLHFHWGIDSSEGSEHVFDDNDDAHTTLEVHFVHYSEDYPSAPDAVRGYYALANNSDVWNNDSNSLAVVGFLFEEVEDGNDDVNEEADYIVGLIANYSDLWFNASVKEGLAFAIIDLVDASDFEQNYLFYYGSLTTPPCTPAVRWHVAQNTIKIRSSTMELFRASAASVDAHGHSMEFNFRPTQSNPSCVYACSVFDDDTDDMYLCPAGGVDSKDGDDDDIVEKLLPLWIILGILGVIFIGVGIWFLLKKRKENSETANRNRATTNDDDDYVNDKDGAMTPLSDNEETNQMVSMNND